MHSSVGKGIFEHLCRLLQSFMRKRLIAYQSHRIIPDRPDHVHLRNIRKRHTERDRFCEGIHDGIVFGLLKGWYERRWSRSISKIFQHRLFGCILVLDKVLYNCLVGGVRVDLGARHSYKRPWSLPAYCRYRCYSNAYSPLSATGILQGPVITIPAFPSERRPVIVSQVPLPA